MFKKHIITTRFAFPDNEKVRGLTERCISSCERQRTFSVEFPVNHSIRSRKGISRGRTLRSSMHKRLKMNFERKAEKPINIEMMNRMLVMQQSMTMSHYKVREEIIKKNETACRLRTRCYRSTETTSV